MNETTKNEVHESIRKCLESRSDVRAKGYDTWLEWCDFLYEPDVHFNLHDRRVSLNHYKCMLEKIFTAFNIEVGDFRSLLIHGDWCAIRYVLSIANKKTNEKMERNAMELILFRNNPPPVGARIVESWVFSENPLFPFL